MEIQRKVLPGLLLSVALTTAVAASRVQTPGALGDLFSHGDGILFSVTIDLPNGEMTSEEARAYGLEKLAALGVPVLELSGEESPTMPRLAISITGKTVPVPPYAAERSAEPHWYEVRYFVQFFDKVVYKRDPSIEHYIPILFSVMTGTFFTREDYLRTAASRRGIRGGIDQRLELFEKACKGDWTFGPVGSVGGNVVGY